MFAFHATGTHPATPALPWAARTPHDNASRVFVLQPNGGERGGEMRVLLDACHMAVTRRHDRGIAPDEVIAARLKRTLVGGVRLYAREPHADDDALADADT